MIGVHAMFEPNHQLLAGNGLTGVRVLVDMTNGTIPIRILNSTNHPVMLHEGMRIGTCEEFSPLMSASINEGSENRNSQKDLLEDLDLSSADLDQVQKQQLLALLRKYISMCLLLIT